ncbi:MAG: amidohydrolase [Promethearchaeota archaeon]|nr:MAG: amidohydrolase [Candidatus Lokiarchaeota archaeon]
MNKGKSMKKIYFGGPILTMNEEMPLVEAIGIDGEIIKSVGTVNQIKKSLHANCQLFDLNGHTMMPGFCDCHLHPIMYMIYLLSPDFSMISSFVQFKEYIKEFSKTKPKDQLIIGYNLNEEKFKNPVLPTRWDLDDACPDKPLFIVRYDSHIGIANSKALELAKIDKFTIPPEGGEIRKDENGNLTGVISEKALELIFCHMSLPGYRDMKKTFIKVSQIFAEKGITSIHGILDAEPYFKEDKQDLSELAIFKRFKKSFSQNCYFFIEIDDSQQLKSYTSSSLNQKDKYAKFKIGGLKLFLDGTLGAKTACMHEPFTDAPEMCGFCVVEEEEIYEEMKTAHNQGFQVVIHTIGDKGCRIAMDLFIRLLKEYPRSDARHRIEHASLLTNDVITDMEKYGVIASCQPPFLNSEYEWLEKRLGSERIKYTYPFKSIINKGAILISGSDCPIEDPSPIQGLHALVNRNNFVPEQCISVKEALKTYTLNAAFASFQEKIKGSIEKGKLADLVILDKNPLTIPRDQIKDLLIMETIIRGKTVYKREE